MPFNRILSLVIGAIVVILALVWIGGRLRDRVMGRSGNQTVTITVTPTPTMNLTITPTPTKRAGWDIFSMFRKQPTPTPTRTVAPQQEESVRMLRLTATPTPVGMVGNETSQTKGGQQPTNNDFHSYTNLDKTNSLSKIPNTGSATLLIPVVISSLFGGVLLSRTKKK